VEEEDEFALRVTDQFSQAVERGERHNDQTSAVFHLRLAKERAILAAPQMHACQSQHRVGKSRIPLRCPAFAELLASKIA